MNTKTPALDSLFPISSFDLLESINAFPDNPGAAELSHCELVSYLPRMLGTAHVLYLHRETNALTGEKTLSYALPKDLAIFVAVAFSGETAQILEECV